MACLHLPFLTRAIPLNPSEIAQHYHYKALQSLENIRLLKVHSDTDTDSSIHCDLIETYLRDPPSYEAISYTWQGQSPTETIYRNKASLPVTKNALAAFRRSSQIEMVRTACFG